MHDILQAQAELIENEGRIKAIVKMPQSKRVEFEKLPQREQENVKKRAVNAALEKHGAHERFAQEMSKGRVKIHVRFS